MAVSRVQKAEADSRFRAALDQHIHLVWRVLRRAGLANANAEDAMQDVFWIFAQRLHEIPPPAERSFLISTAFRVAADRKRLRWHRSVIEPLELEGCPGDAPLPDEAVDLARARALLDQTLAALSSEDRSVFVLAELEGMTRAEVASTLDIPEGTVASRLRRGRQTFASALHRFRLRGASRP